MRIVIIGGVAAGMSAAGKAARTNPAAEVEVYTKEAYISYSACSLPYLAKNVMANESDLIARTPEQMAKQGVAVHILHEATKILPEEKAVLVRGPSGEETRVPYDRLIIATGARPIVPRLPGVGAEGVFTIKGIPDVHALQSYIAKRGCRSAVIVGGGFIGVEMADALKSLDIGTTIVEKLPQILPPFDADMAGMAQAALEEHGVRVLCGAGVTGIEQDADGRVRAVRTEAGELIAELVILAIGVTPNTEIAASAGVELGARGAIRVDARMRTNVPDIYAAGDCACTTQLVTGAESFIPMGTTANKAGKVAGENAAGGWAEFLGVTGTMIFKLFDKEAAKTGLSLREAMSLGLDAREGTIHSHTRAYGYPGAGDIAVKLVVENGTDRLLGGQIFGDEGAAKRIDVLAGLVHLRATVADLAALDLAYAPPFAPVWDPLLVAANQALPKGK